MRCAHGKRMCPTIYVTGCGSASAQLQTRRQQSRRRVGRRAVVRAPAMGAPTAARRRRACARTTRCAAARHAHAPLCDSGVSAPPRTSMPAAAGRRRTPLTRRGSEASPAPASTSRGRMGRRRGERRGQTCAGARAPWAGRARSSARRTVAAAAAAGPRTRRGAAVAPGSANTRSGAPRESAEPPEQPRRARPMSADNVPSTTCGRRAPSTAAGRDERKPRARGGSGSGGRHPPRSGASAWPRLGARRRDGAAGLRVRNSVTFIAYKSSNSSYSASFDCSFD